MGRGRGAAFDEPADPGRCHLRLGPEVWQNTYVLLPPELTTAGYHNALTGQHRAVGQPGKAGLAVGDVLAAASSVLV